jgi:6-pyruvoyltetrahydropterin/6-carboxytetrahydropterin synthase
MYRLSSKKMISAAHVLRGYDGPCSRLHGHNWNVKIDVLSSELNEIGLSIDFNDLDDILWQVAGPFDHNNFNDFPPFDKINPTAENISRYFFNEIKKRLPEYVKLEKVSIWETDDYLVEYFEND